MVKVENKFDFIKTKKNKANEYIIYEGDKEIGSIIYVIKDNIMILASIYIDSNLQGEGYGYKVINHIISDDGMGLDAVIGESVKQSAGFWRKCISKFNGREIEETRFENCPFSFVIPDVKLTDEQVTEYIRLTAEVL